MDPQRSAVTGSPLWRLAPFFAASLVIQVCIALLPDRMGDLLVYREWTRRLASEGLLASYWPASPAVPGEPSFAIDYPPVLPLLLLGVGKFARFAAPGLLESDRVLDSLVRLPLIAANLGIGLVVFRALGPGRPAALAAAALQLLNPAFVFDTAYWGQADALVTLFLVGGVAASQAGRPGRCWALLSLGILTKPVVVPFLPIVAAHTLWRHGAAALARGVSVALCAALVPLAPFLFAGRLGPALFEFYLQLDAMPFVSVNAHNLGFLLTGGLPWRPAGELALPGVSWERLGLLMVGAAQIFALWRLHRRPDDLAPVAAWVGISFFMLSTHMHENHLLYGLPLLALGLEGPRGRALYLALSATALANMALHDPLLGRALDGGLPGPLVALPQQPDLPRELMRYLEGLGYADVVRQIRGETTLARFALCLANASANLALLVVAAARIGPDAWSRVARALTWAALSLGLVLSARAVLDRDSHTETRGSTVRTAARCCRSVPIATCPGASSRTWG